MANYFDQFDQQQPQGNYFDQFDAPTHPEQQANPQIGNPQDLTFAEKYVAPALEKLGVGDIAGGNLRGSAVGGAFQGAADPGVAIVQTAANLVSPIAEAISPSANLSSLVTGQDNSIAGRVNRAVSNEEQQYQQARASAGRSGVDLARIGGNVAVTAPLAGVGAAPEGASIASTALRGAATGAGFGALQPVTNATDATDFAKQKAKQAGVGAVAGGATSLLASMIARAVSPLASVDPRVQLLRDEGVQPTIGQTLGGAANSLEEKAQSLPFLGPKIQAARQGANAKLEQAAYGRVLKPLTDIVDDPTISGTGNTGISELSDKFNEAYGKVLPKLSVNVTDQNFVDRMSNLRGLVQGLPPQEAQQFDNLISREIDQRLSPNGTLSGQNLKDAWNALRDAGNQFSRSNDAYQSQLGQAYKQAFQELKDQVSATNPAADVSALRNVDFAYANFKRLQRASTSIGADEGHFTPAQLQSAVKALDSSKDKARFASGDALMQDLSSAGKSVLTNKVPDSGTAARVGLGMAGSSIASAIAGAPVVPLGTFGALAGGSLLYSKPVQNALTALVANRPEMAPVVANYLRRLALPATTATVPLLEQGYAQ